MHTECKDRFNVLPEKSLLCADRILLILLNSVHKYLEASYKGPLLTFLFSLVLFWLETYFWLLGNEILSYFAKYINFRI